LKEVAASSYKTCQFGVMLRHCAVPLAVAIYPLRPITVQN